MSRTSTLNPLVPRLSSVTAALLLSALLVAQAAAQDLVLRGGHVFDTDRGEFRENPGIVVVAGRIHAVGSEHGLAASRTPLAVELSDQDHVLPGIFDLHAHYNVNLLGRRRRDETEVNPVVFLANGVTSTFPAGEYDPEDMLALRRAIDRGERVGPRIFSTGPYFGRARRGWSRDRPVGETLAEVDLWAERGVAGFKAKGIDPVHLEALIRRAHQHGLTVTAHLDSGFRGSVNPRDAIAMGLDRVEHFLGGDAFPADRPAYSSLVDFRPGTEEFRDIVARYVEHGVVFDATLTAYGYFGERSSPEYSYWVEEREFFTPYVQELVRGRPPRRVNQQFEQIFQAKLATVRAFHEAGGTVTLGTDHASTGEYLGGFGAHREIEALARAGIPPADVLRIATIHGARALGVGDRLGSIEPGKLADLFVVRGNPLEDVRRTRRVHLVVKGGHPYHTAELLDSVRGRLGPASEDEVANW